MTDLLKQEQLASYIQKEINQYKKPVNKNDGFKAQLIAKAFETPSPLWVIYAPTKSLQHDFQVVENKLMAKKWLKAFEAKTDTLSSISEICYQSCLIKEGKNVNTLDESKLKVWTETFKSTNFQTELNLVTQKWMDWNSKSLKEKLSSVEQTVGLIHKMKI